MTVRERIERRAEFSRKTFIAHDPEFGNIICSVDDFFGERRDGKQGFREDHPALSYEVVQVEV